MTKDRRQLKEKVRAKASLPQWKKSIYFSFYCNSLSWPCARGGNVGFKRSVCVKRGDDSWQNQRGSSLCDAFQQHLNLETWKKKTLYPWYGRWNGLKAVLVVICLLSASWQWFCALQFVCNIKLLIHPGTSLFLISNFPCQEVEKENTCDILLLWKSAVAKILVCSFVTSR